MRLIWEGKSISRVLVAYRPAGTVWSLALTLVVCGLAARPVQAQDVSCPNEPSRAEQPFASGLPDCRAYEMVSPLEKDDNGVTYLAARAAMSGEAVTYFSLGSFAGPKAALLEGRYLSRREASGWSTSNISPPYTEYVAVPLNPPPFSELLFTPDLSSGVVSSVFTPLVGGQPVGYVNLYVADVEAGSYQPVTTVTPEAEYRPFTESLDDTPPQVEGASSDLGHVVFQQEASLCCGASPKHPHVYEWAKGKLALVDVAPKGVKLEEVNVGSEANFYNPAAHGNPWRAVSADGSRVVFTAAERPSRGVPEWQVFSRENPLSPVEDCAVVGDACTVEVSASQKTDGSGPGGSDPFASREPAAGYRDASVDGSRVFFTSKVELTNDANTGPEDNAANLYEYNMETGVLRDLTVDDSDSDGAAVLGLVTASEDGSYVYFVAEGKLASGQGPGGEEAAVGMPNLYLSYPGGVRFIATLAPSVGNSYHIDGRDDGENGDEEDWVGLNDTDFDYGPGWHSARVSPDGSMLAFESVRELTGFDNRPAAVGECALERCREVFLYDAESDSHSPTLVCVSCGPPDVSPVGPAELGGHEEENSTVSGVSTYYLPRNMPEGDRRLFFESPDALVARDSNGLLDVYEWERLGSASEVAAGESSCVVSSPEYDASEGGCVSPISNVAGGYGSHFMDASPSGNDVFIATADQLVPSDTDVREDVYDVRVGGGFPVSVAAAVCVNADSCKPPVSSQPGVFGAPASATFSGPGNPVPVPTSVAVVTRKAKGCRKGFVRGRRGKCVKIRKKAGGRRRTRKVGRDGRGVRS